MVPNGKFNVNQQSAASKFLTSRLVLFCLKHGVDKAHHLVISILSNLSGQDQHAEPGLSQKNALWAILI